MNLPDDIAELLTQAAQRNGIAPALARAVAWVESRGKADAVSRAGAQGVMQLMPRTAQGLGVEDPFDARQNIDGGVRMLARLVRQYGEDVGKALAAYNWGPGNVTRVPNPKRWPHSVRRYVQLVQARSEVEDELLSTGNTDRPPAPSGGGAAADPFEQARAEAAAPPAAPSQSGSLASFPPPHCPSCTCDGGES